MTTHFRTCPLCEAMCGLEIETRGDEVTRIRGDADDPFSRGHLCPKAMALKDLHEDPDRLRTPLRRVGEHFVPVDWEEAYDLVAAGVQRVQRAHGKHAVALYQGNPTVHNYGSMLYAPMFMAALGSKSRFSATSVDQLPHMLANLWMFGHQMLFPVPDVDRTEYLLILGANPAVSNGSLMTAPGVARRLRRIRERGGKVVVLDPRHTETAALASEHHFIRPGTDAAFLLAVLHSLFEAGQIRLGHLAPHLSGLEALRGAVRLYSPERVSAFVGLDAGTIRRLASELFQAERAVCYGRIGVSTQDFGGLACWLVNALNVVTGNLDRVGGAMFPAPAVDLVSLPGRRFRGHYGLYKSRVRGLPEFGGELPAAVLAEEIDTPGPGRLRGLITSAGNPVLSTPNGARLERALPGLEFMASIDFYLNETTRHAHVILPPTGPLEHDHYDLAFHALAVRNTAKYSPAVFSRPAHARHDWEILGEITWRLARGRRKRAWARVQAELLRRLGPEGILDGLLRLGHYGDRGPLRPGLSLKRLRAEPHGIDLGPLQSQLPGRMRTQKLQLAPQPMLDDLPRLERALQDAQGVGSLQLIGRRQLRSNNSWMHNSVRLVKGKERCTLQMHPDDARSRGVRDGQQVTLRSRAGQVQAPVELTEEVMAGVVSLPHGWGHDRPGTALRVAAQHPGASLNDVTEEGRVDVLSGNASFSGVPVVVEASPGAGGE